MLLTAGLNFQMPREFASNSTVIVRLLSTWELAPVDDSRPHSTLSESVNTLMPSAVQTALYRGTNA